MKAFQMDQMTDLLIEVQGCIWLEELRGGSFLPLPEKGASATWQLSSQFWPKPGCSHRLAAQRPVAMKAGLLLPSPLGLAANGDECR